MKSTFWDIASFNVSMESQYRDLYALEDDIHNLIGSSNISELDSLDWFLLDKETKELSFLSLGVPSFFYIQNEYDLIDFDALRDLELSTCVEKFMHNVANQDISIFSIKKNILLVSSDISLACYKTLVADNLYFLLADDFSYCGFFLTNATNHIPDYIDSLEKGVSDTYFSRMFDLCNQASYDAMDEQDAHYLCVINQLEKDCLAQQHIDKRLLQIVKFIKNVKATFYDIDIEE